MQTAFSVLKHSVYLNIQESFNAPNQAMHAAFSVFKHSVYLGHSTWYGAGYRELCLDVEQQSCMRWLWTQPAIEVMCLAWNFTVDQLFERVAYKGVLSACEHLGVISSRMTWLKNPKCSPKLNTISLSHNWWTMPGWCFSANQTWPCSHFRAL